MTTQQDHGSGQLNGLAGYLQAMETGDAPVLGHLVLYSVFEGSVTRDDLERWFGELGLDTAFVPGRSARSTRSRKSPAPPKSAPATRSGPASRAAVAAGTTAQGGKRP